MVPGEVLVKLKEAADADELAAQGRLSAARRPTLAALLARYGDAHTRRPSARLTGRRLDRHVKMTARKGTTLTETLELVKSLREQPEVEYAEPNRILKAVFTPNDPYFASSGAWGQTFRDLWGLEKLNVSSAWDRTRAHFEQLFATMAKANDGRMGNVSALSYQDHPAGGCRMGTDPATSVVDPSGRTHDHDNLFVVGSPTLPTGGCTNGTLTFVALALRSADTIAAV
jgi:hypothetical protein